MRTLHGQGFSPFARILVTMNYMPLYEYYSDGITTYRKGITSGEFVYEILLNNNFTPPPIMSQYKYYTDGTVQYRDGVRNGQFVLDKALTATGFTGTENIDWETVAILNSNEI